VSCVTSESSKNIRPPFCVFFLRYPSFLFSPLSSNYQSTPYQYTMTIPWSAKDEEVVALLVNDDFAGMDARCCFSARFPGRKSVFVHSKSNSPKIDDQAPSFSLGLEEHGDWLFLLFPPVFCSLLTQVVFS
jgi:hypothetical protein